MSFSSSTATNGGNACSPQEQAELLRDAARWRALVGLHIVIYSAHGAQPLSVDFCAVPMSANHNAVFIAWTDGLVADARAAG